MNKRISSTIRHVHEYCPCTICNDPENIKNGIIMCIKDNCFEQKDLQSTDKMSIEQALDTIQEDTEKAIEDLQSTEKPIGKKVLEEMEKESLQHCFDISKFKH